MNQKKQKKINPSPQHKPASYLFWKIQSELSKTGLQLAKVQEALEKIEEKAILQQLEKH